MAERIADPDGIKLFSYSLFTQLGGAVTAGMVHLGDKLGLFAALAAADGPVSSEELAASTGLDERWVRLDERWVREWAYNQAAAKLITAETDDLGANRFWLTPEGVAVLASPDHSAYGVGMFHRFPQTMGALEEMPECFKPGSGMTTTATARKERSVLSGASNPGIDITSYRLCCQHLTGLWI